MKMRRCRTFKAYWLHLRIRIFSLMSNKNHIHYIYWSREDEYRHWHGLLQTSNKVYFLPIYSSNIILLWFNQIVRSRSVISFFSIFRIFPHFLSSIFSFWILPIFCYFSVDSYALRMYVTYTKHLFVTRQHLSTIISRT